MNKRNLAAKLPKLFLTLVMVLVLIGTLLGAVYSLAWGEWPASLALLLVGSSYFVITPITKVSSSGHGRVARILKLGYWLSFGAMVALSAASTTSIAAHSLLNGWAIGLSFYVWVIFYAATITLAARRFLLSAHGSRHILYRRAAALVLVALVIIAPLTFVEVRSEQDVSRLIAAVNEIAWKKLAPAGAIPYAPKGGSNTFYRKDGLFGRADCNFVHPCPTGGGEWLMVISKSRSARHDFAVSTLKSLGYTYGGAAADGEVGGAKRGVGISLGIINLSGEKTPYPAPPGKVWQRVEVAAELSSGSPADNNNAQTQPVSNQYTSNNNHFSFSYPQSWTLENDSTPNAEILLLKSPDGEFALQPSGEPMAASGEVIHVTVTPCSGGRACSPDGVYDGIYQYSDHGPQLQLDDGTLYDSFYFQYRGEQATLYSVFFRDGNKYVFTFNAASATRDQLDLNSDASKIFSPLIAGIRFDDIK